MKNQFYEAVRNRIFIIVLGMVLSVAAFGQSEQRFIRFDFYGDTVAIPAHVSVQVPFQKPITKEGVEAFYEALQAGSFQQITQTLLDYKQAKKLDDWVFYQLIRSTAEHLSPKAANYERYTLYKWYLLIATGYSTMISIKPDKMLLYIQSDEDVFEIPCRTRNGKQFVCLNYHDYGVIDFNTEKFNELVIGRSDEGKEFTYKITSLPSFRPESYAVKELQFEDGQKEYNFKVLVNEQVKKIFANYPVLDYKYYFNIPLSGLTYSSLIPLLKEQVKGMNQKKGVDYLMRFTRYAFPFATDTKIHGKEKRLTPEQTLLYEYSDCEDRAAFFFYLVREIYNLPMIVLGYPDHITVAVKFDSPVGRPVEYKGQQYSICEATPQRKNLRLGQLLDHLKDKPFEVVYEYHPQE